MRGRTLRNSQAVLAESTKLAESSKYVEICRVTMSRRLGNNVLQFESFVSSSVPSPPQCRSRFAGMLKTVKTVPGKCYDYFDELTKDRSHSFAFKLDQMRQVSIDITNRRKPGFLGDLARTRNIQVILWSESGSRRQLFSIAPGDRDRETVTLNSGRYLLELKTHTSKKVNYALKLMPMKWLLLDYFAS